MSVFLIFPKGYTLTLPQPLQGCGLLNVMALNEPKLATFFFVYFCSPRSRRRKGRGREEKRERGLVPPFFAPATQARKG